MALKILFILALFLQLCTIHASLQSSAGIMDSKLVADRMQEVQGTRHQRFSNANTPPLETLFSMQKVRRDNLQTYVSEMMQHTRLHAEAKRKVQEDMDAIRRSKS